MASQTEQPARAARQAELSEEVAAALEKGRVQFERGRYRAAIDTWRAVYERRSANSTLTAAERQTLQRRIAEAHFARSHLAIGRQATAKGLRRALERIGEALRWDPENALFAFEAGRCHWRLGRRAQALVLFSQALQSRGATSQMRYYTALAQFHTGRPADALRTLAPGPATEDPPHFVRAWRRLQVCATAAAGDPVGAVARLSAWVESDPSSEWISDTVALARSVEPTPELCKAVEALYTAVNPKGPAGPRGELADLLGDMHARLGHEERALSWWNEALRLTGNEGCALKICSVCERQAVGALEAGDYATGLRWCATGLEVRPEQQALKRLQRQLKLLSAQALWKEMKIDEALAIWNELLERDQLLEAAWNMALACEEAGRRAKAAAAWRRVAALSQERKQKETARQAALRAGCLHLQQGEYREALADLELAADPADPDPVALRLLAFAALLEGEPGNAAALIEQTLALGPEDPELLVGLAAAFDATDAPHSRKIERWRQAMSVCDEPWIRDTWRRRTLELGLKAWRENDLDRAMDVFAGLLFDNRYEPDGWIWCGTIHLQRGNAERAAVCFDHAIDVAPESDEILVKIGGCYLMAGREEEADQYFRKAQEVAPRPGTDVRIAEVCLQIGRRDVAFKHLTGAVARTKEHSGDLYRILQLLVEVREGHDLQPLLEQIAAVIDKPYRVEFFIGAEKIWTSQWNEVQKIFDRVREAATEHRDTALLEDLRYAERAMILLLTTGTVDYEEFSGRIREVARRYVVEEVPEVEENPLDIVRRMARRRLAEAIDGVLAEGVSIREAPSETPQPQLQSALPDFGRPPDWDRLIPAAIESAKVGAGAAR